MNRPGAVSAGETPLIPEGRWFEAIGLRGRQAKDGLLIGKLQFSGRGARD